MKKIFLFFCLFLLASCQNEYTQFHQEKQLQEANIQKTQSFTFDDINSIS